MSTGLEFRQELVERLEVDLVGAVTENEVLEDRPSERYLTGILFPQNSDVPPEEDEDLAEGTSGDTAGNDLVAASSGVGLTNVKRPSTAGVSFAVSSEARPKIMVYVTGATYDPCWIGGGDSLTKVKGKNADLRWKRMPFNIRVPEITLVEGRMPAIALAELGADGLDLQFQVAQGRRQGGFVDHTVTAVLVNQNQGAKDKQHNEESTFFQVRLVVTAGQGTRLIPRPSRRSGEDADLELLYRGASEFAVGHTCSADWKTGSDDELVEVSTCWIPVADVSAISPLGDTRCKRLEENTLNSNWLGQASAKELVQALRRLPGAYLEWLDEVERDELSLVPNELVDQARRHLAECRKIANRIEGSIAAIEKNPDIRKAFQLANQAITKQATWASQGDLTWRPFQLAFQLVVLESLANQDHEDRGVMDLLWFPTGGGKTEAYLALVAFTMIYRRLSHGQDGEGTAAFMRYTLRLLTIDQFQRAARLVTACEVIRRGSSDLGSVPFSIGLWVGAAATPNRIQDAKDQIAKDENPTPRQLVHCPACGTRLDWQIARVQSAEQVRVTCPGSECEIGSSQDKSLPVYTVDQDIYRVRPSLLIGTIDKFAQITFQAQNTRNLFGGPDTRPPDLVLQDELHLISGPLGSLAGIYEMAIDELCSVRSETGQLLQRPKIIGSTATIKRASEQICRLFDRDTCQFPPPVLEASRSFFTRPASADEHPGRKFAAVTTAGRSPKFALQAVYGSLLHSGGAIDATPDESRDPWWTLLGYFNSLRELGGSWVMLSDDVPVAMSIFARARGEHDLANGIPCSPRDISEIDELTSRKGQVELRDTLQRLKEREYPAVDAFDATLATNMISVGVDVNRLGLMVIFAQPKQTAEYIQASSRVGRQHPGLIVGVYKNNFARDRSHYETFKTWHQALYRDVEPSSVTPLASRARDKALHAAIVAIASAKIRTLDRTPLLDSVTRKEVEVSVVKPILERAKRIDPTEYEGTRNDITEFLDNWERRSTQWDDSGVTPTYRTGRDPANSLLIAAEDFAVRLANDVTTGGATATMNSMRDVEPAAPFKLVEGLVVESGGTDDE